MVMVSDPQLAHYAQESYNRSNVWSGNSCAQVTTLPHSLVIAFRGTNDIRDWANNVWAIPWQPDELGAWVHRGFWLYTKPLIKALLYDIDRRGLPVYITGHSLGGAAACIFAAICKRRGIAIERLTTFGAPRPGYRSLAGMIRDIPGKRYVIDGDQVTSVPPSWFAFPYTHHKAHLLLPGIPGIIDHPMPGYVAALQSTT